MAARPPNRTPSKADRHLKALQQAMQVFAKGDHAGALGSIRTVLKSSPSDAQAHRLCAVVLKAQGDTDRALFHAEKAVALAPAAAAVHTTLGSVLESAGDHERALTAMRRAVELNPADTEALSTLAGALDTQGEYDEALELHTRAYDAAQPSTPARAHAGMNLGLALLAAGRAHESVDLLTELARAFPTQPAVLQRLAYCLNYDDRATRADLNRAHRRWGVVIEAHTPAARTKTINAAAANENSQPRRVALISPDLRAHSVANFVGPLLDCLDRERFTLCAYFTSRHADAVTESLRPRAAEWHDCPGIADADLARTLADDSIDIAIDLTGHFAGNRLGAFARTPAPLQLTWLGYPTTTGLTRIHARVVDSYTDPESVDSAPPADREAERLVRLDPCFLCYEPPATGPVPAERAPLAAGEPFTLGSFNDLKKLSPTTIDLWSRTLTAIPGSRLLLKAQPLDSASVRASTTAAFAERGIDADRLTLMGRSETRDEHLAVYNQLDLALDTYPYHGTTTTCESLWMGVPVLSRIGDGATAPHAARVGLSLLTNAGLPDLCARDDDAFVAKALELATNADALTAVRTNLRERFASSPVCDAPAFAARFADMLDELIHAAG